MKKSLNCKMKKINPPFLRLGVFVITFLLIITSCLDDRYDFSKISDEIEITPGLAAPIAYGSFTIADILDEVNTSGYVKEYDDNLLYIVYSDKLLSFRSSDIIDIPDQTFLELYLDSEFVIPPGFQVGQPIHVAKEKNGEFVFLNNERIDSIFLKNSTLRIDIRSTFRHTGTLTISSPNIIIDGVPFSEEIKISTTSGNFSETLNIPLEGSKISLDNSNPDTTFLPLRFDLELINSGFGVSSGDKCDISMSLVNIDFYSAFGYLGDYELLYDAGGVGIQIFDSELEEGSIRFYDPQFHFEINNSYGIPVSVELYDVMARSEIEDGLVTPVTFSGQNSFILPVEGATTVGSSALTDTVFNTANSNIADALETQPNEFFFKAKATTNPPGSGSLNNFLTDSSKIDVDFQVVLPIWIKAEGFTLSDTTDFDMEEEFGEAVEYIERLKVTLDATNGLPLEVDLQVLFLDENYSIIDSMFIDNKMFLEPALLDLNDEVIEGKSQTHEISFSSSRLEAIKSTKYAIVKAAVSTAGASEDNYVKFFSDYKIDFKLKLMARFNINSRDL